MLSYLNQIDRFCLPKSFHPFRLNWVLLLLLLFLFFWETVDVPTCRHWESILVLVFQIFFGLIQLFMIVLCGSWKLSLIDTWHFWSPVYFLFQIKFVAIHSLSKVSKTFPSIRFQWLFPSFPTANMVWSRKVSGILRHQQSEVSATLSSKSISWYPKRPYIFLEIEDIISKFKLRF